MTPPHAPTFLSSQARRRSEVQPNTPFTMKTRHTRRFPQTPGHRPWPRLQASGYLVAQPPAVIDPQWEWHYRTLLGLRDRLARDAEAKLRESAIPVENHGTHPADSGTDEYDHDLALTLLAAEENALSEVNDAILRILGGRYGVCEATGAKIPHQRLRAIPWCRYTRDVERRREETGKVPGREGSP